MNEIALMEAASSVYKRKYQCPYCDEKYDRVKLVDHIEKKHSEFIPKDFTASRVVFNLVNKKEKGKCTICGKESPWDEDKCRYDRFCSEKCKKAYEQLAAERLKRVRGMTKQEMLKDPEYQNNVMLANRSISGKYKFQDGTIRTYVGSYEHKFLEFMDKFLNVKSEDLETPGPIIEYKFKGETHKWITDAYYAPYNLAFDIKDGGDNPNKREMPEYRAKQTAKEDAIKKQGKYNYIRLTDNKFEQLIELMLELKELYIENNGEYNPIIRINESTILESKKAKDLGPKVCNKCGSKNIGVFLQGEPIYKCKDCGKYLGTVPFNESASVDIIQNAFNSVIHTIKWCRMDSSAFCSIKEYSEPKIVNDNSFSAGRFVYESGIDTVVKTINDNNIFENGKYSASCNNNELIITIDKLNNMNESYIIDKINKGDNNMIHENKSTLDLNHKTKKTDTTFKFIDLKDPSVDKYLKQDKYCTEYWDYIHKSCIGEIVIDADNDCIAGYVFLDNKKYPGFITPVVVIKKYRGYGLSSKLVKDAINKYGAIDLTVTKGNEVAIKLYKDNGFVIIGDGNSKNEYWMKLKSKLTDEEKSKVVKEYCILHDKGYFKLLDKYKDPKDCSWDEEQTYPTIDACVRAEKCFGKDRYCYSMDIDSYTIHYIGKMHVSNFEDDGYGIDWLETTDDYPFPRDDIKESELKSSVNSKFDKKVNKSLNNYNKIYIDSIHDIPDNYKDQIKIINYLDEYDCGYIWIDNNNLVALCTVSKLQNTGEFSKMKWITGIEISKKYRGMSLSKQLLDVATKELGGNALSVDSDNEVAIKVYEKYGFKISDKTKGKNRYLMYLGNILKEFSVITPSSAKPSQEGFINHGSWNAVRKVNGEPYRERVEVIIFNKDLDKVLIGTKRSNGRVKLPGGGTDKNSSLETQAAKECQEEVKINIDNLKYIGSYSTTNEQLGHKDDVYKGQYTYLYLATYDSDYTGYIRPEDLDSLYDTAKWVSIYDAKKLLKKRSVDLYNLFNFNYKLYINDLSYLKL